MKFTDVSLNRLANVARQIVNEIFKTQPPIIVYFDAEMGLGKTTLTAELLYTLGLNRRIPVTSPTFTYVNYYEIDTYIYAHLDLYRCEQGCDLVEFGLDDLSPYRALFIEWPEKLEAEFCDQPDWNIQISTGSSPKTRNISLNSRD